MNRFMVCLCMLIVSAGAWAYDFVVNCNGVDLYFEKRDVAGEVEVVSHYVNFDDPQFVGVTKIVVPEEVTYDGVKYKVTTIGNQAFSFSPDLEEVFFANTITLVDNQPFYNCPKLTSVYINDGVTELANVFNTCPSLKNIRLPKTLTSVYYLVHDCDGLDSLEIPGSGAVVEYAAYGCDNLKWLRVPGVSYMNRKLFKNCPALKELVIGEGAETFAEYYLAEMETLEKVVLPSSVKKISYAMFSGSENLKSVELGAGCKATSIESFAFSECTSLERFDMPETIESIGNVAFGHTALTSVNIGSNVKTIGGGAYRKSKLTEVVVPKNVTDMGYGIFQECNSLKKATINADITILKNQMFRNCEFLGTIIINSPIKEVWQWAFQGCEHLSTLKLPNSVEIIKESAIEGWKYKNSVELPANLKTVEKGNFNCEHLQIIKLKCADPSQFNLNSTSVNKNHTTLYVPKGSKAAYDSSPDWQGYAFILEWNSRPQDVNSDDKINSADVVTVYNYVINGEKSGVSKEAADVNGDDKVNSADVVAVYNYIITGN